MKPTTLARNSVSTETVDLISRLVDLITWTEQRLAMGDITLSLLDGKFRVAETVFGWNRSTIAMGINEFQVGIACINDLSTRLNPKSEVKNPKLLAEYTPSWNLIAKTNPVCVQYCCIPILRPRCIPYAC